MNDLKNTFDKVKLDESKAAEIRDKLIRKKGVNRAWLIPVVAVMTALIIVLTIPTARDTVIGAMAFNDYTLITANGVTVKHYYNPLTGKETWEYIDPGIDYSQVKDGRLYLVIGDEWMDVTDYCSASEYYLYEIDHEDGSKELIFIGGTPDEAHGCKHYGWYELAYDPNGFLIMSGGHIESLNKNNSGWLDKVHEDYDSWLGSNV